MNTKEDLKRQENQIKAESLLDTIRDAHLRMATNRDVHYRKQQRDKIDGCLERLTILIEQDPFLLD